MISVIIPTYNEAENIVSALEQFRGMGDVEVIVVDGGSTDNTVALAGKYVTVISATKNRAAQMNAGAAEALGDILLFLHADVQLPEDGLRAIEKTCESNEGGGFYICFDSKNPVFRLVEFHSNKIRVGITKNFFGDQGIFVKKRFFQELGGFDEVPFLEDLVFSKKAKKHGKMKLIKEKVLVSPRRFTKNGMAKTILIYTLIQQLHHLGIGVHRLHKLHGWLK